MQTIDDSVDFLKYLGDLEAAYVVPASKFTDDVLAELNGLEERAGDLLPWPKTHNLVALRPGEVSIWGGFNGHGKSQILGQVCAWGLMKKKWLVASMEMPPAKTMKRMLRQACGYVPTNDHARKFMQWTDDKLWIYDQTDTVKSDRILGMVHYAAQELKINHIVIDSLMKCGFRGSKDQMSSEQVGFVDRLCWAAKTENIHIHLVHHMRKGAERGEYARPGKHDYRGAGELVDLVDNAFIIHRNKKKEDLISRGEICDEADATLEIVKQRHGEAEPFFKLWFDKESQQYTQNEDNTPVKLGF